MKLSLVDVMLVLVYLGLLMTLGSVFIYRQFKPQQFMFWKKDFRGELLGVTFASKAISSVGFLMIMDVGFLAHSWVLMQLLAMPLIGFYVGRWCVGALRESGESTIYSYLGKRLGRWATIYGGVSFAIITLMRSALSIYVMLKILSLECKDPALILAVVIGVVVSIYVYLGGIAGILWTNVFNTIMKYVGLGVVLICLVTRLQVGGEWGITEAINLQWMEGEEMGLYVFLMFAWMMDMFSFGFSQTSGQLYLCARSEKEARKGLWMGLVLMGLMVTVLWLVGYLTQVYVTQRHEDLGLLQSNAMSVFSVLMEQVLPTGVKGLFLIAFIAAGLGVVAIDLSSLSMLFYNDFYCVYWNQPYAAPEQRMLHVHKGALMIGALMVLLGVGFYYWDLVGYLLIWWNITSILVSGVLGLFVLITFSKRVNSFGAVVGVILGTLMAMSWILVGSVYEAFLLPLGGVSGLLVLPLSVIVIVISGWLSSFVFSRRVESNI